MALRHTLFIARNYGKSTGRGQLDERHRVANPALAPYIYLLSAIRAVVTVFPIYTSKPYSRVMRNVKVARGVRGSENNVKVNITTAPRYESVRTIYIYYLLYLSSLAVFSSHLINNRSTAPREYNSRHLRRYIPSEYRRGRGGWGGA